MKAVRLALTVVVSPFFSLAFGAESTPDPNLSAATFDFADPDPAFIIYLETQEVPASVVQDYLNGLDQFLHTLGNHDMAGARRVLTNLAANTKLDAGLCDELGHRIDATLVVLGQKDKVEKTDRELQSSLTQPDQSPDEVADALRRQSETAQNGNSAANTTAPGSPLSMHLTENYLKDARIREAISANDRNYALLVDQCRSDFASYIAALEAAGHIRQLPLAVACYRWLFPGSDDSYIQQVLARSHNKAVSLDQMLATVQDESTRYHLVAVARQLEAAYRAGPNDPRLQDVPLTLKKPVLAFIFEETKLRAAMQARDPDACEKLLPEMSRRASDFDSRPLQVFVEAIRKRSQFLTNQAKAEMQQGQTASALDDFQAASAAWPGNPALQSGAINLVLRQQSKLVSLQKFDEYWIQADYDSLVLHAQDLALFLDGDARRQAELTQAQKNVRATDFAFEQAATLQAAGKEAQAWETLELASRSWPTNKRLNELKVVLAPAATNFVHAIKQAEEAEKRNDLGLSLSWYAVAQSYAAQSQLAQQGIDRMAKRILQ